FGLENTKNKMFKHDNYRLIILPKGVVSKKLVGALNTRLIALLCNLLAALTPL
ncbi:5553_t:CDS:1, partial [Ambispora leptoticha]